MGLSNNVLLDGEVVSFNLKKTQGAAEKERYLEATGTPVVVIVRAEGILLRQGSCQWGADIQNSSNLRKLMSPKEREKAHRVLRAGAPAWSWLSQPCSPSLLTEEGSWGKKRPLQTGVASRFALEHIVCTFS